MTFSLRLTADLTRALAVRTIRQPRQSPVLQISPDADVLSVVQSRAPILWVAGPEPLDYPEVARLANTLAASGRSVFLETSGASLKPRLHEFRPSSRFYFAARFDAFGTASTQDMSLDGSFGPGIEAVRMARLAGFFACAHLVVPSDAAGIEQLLALHAQVAKRGVDGFLITAPVHSLDLDKTAKQVRRRLLSARWALLSRLIESASRSTVSQSSREAAPLPASESQQDRLGESVEAG